MKLVINCDVTIKVSADVEVVAGQVHVLTTALGPMSYPIHVLDRDTQLAIMDRIVAEAREAADRQAAEEPIL